MPGASKQSSAVRARSSLSQVSTPPAISTPKSRKAAKTTLIVRLKIAPKRLAQLAGASSLGDTTKAKETSKATSSADSPSIVGGKSDSNDSSSVQGLEEPHLSDRKLKQDDKVVKAGVKRESGAGVTVDEQAKAKAAQRKRPKV